MSMPQNGKPSGAHKAKISHDDPIENTDTNRTNNKTTPTRQSQTAHDHAVVFNLSHDDRIYDSGSPTLPYISSPTVATQIISWRLELQQLESLKETAVTMQKFLMAEQLKHQITDTKKVIALTLQKQIAVREENYLLAIHLKQNIEELQQSLANGVNKQKISRREPSLLRYCVLRAAYAHGRAHKNEILRITVAERILMGRCSDEDFNLVSIG